VLTPLPGDVFPTERSVVERSAVLLLSLRNGNFFHAKTQEFNTP
jgi:hypothetical protein